jgi:hypothetical protein
LGGVQPAGGTGNDAVPAFPDQVHAVACIETLERYVTLGIIEVKLSAVCPAPEMAAQYARIAAEILPHFAR